MRLADVGEFGLIRNISSLCSVKKSSILLSIGDDAAAITFKKPIVLATTDMLIEGVHFDLAYTTFFQLGYKTLAVNVSDIAAMGGQPEFFLLSVGIPQSFDAQWIEELYRGINELAQMTNTHVVGGDTCVSGSFVLSGTLLGSADRVVSRSGAQAGDTIYVTNNLGDSAAGMALLQAYGKTVNLEDNSFGSTELAPFEPLVRRHLMPTPRFLDNISDITSMIDISDGLLQDLGHICEQSGKGAKVYLNQIPMSDTLRHAAERLNRNPLDFALRGGEDYELIFTSSSALQGFFPIGEITEHEKVVVDHEDGQVTSVEWGRGYEHFK
ncbi:MAG TPA: thiamine-phosphate kinase [Thermodesulfovibrionia bacterium]|nr:thiamine-phosphate kinase [Thermodesulfovibrionia bacterium]